MDFSANIILGAAGAEKWRENASASAQLLNEVRPYLIFLATLHVDAGSPLYKELKAGAFVENTLGQNIQEELELLRRLDLDGTAFFGLHTSNVIPVAGTLPEDKEKLLETLEKGMQQLYEKELQYLHQTNDGTLTGKGHFDLTEGTTLEYQLLVDMTSATDRSPPMWMTCWEQSVSRFRRIESAAFSSS